METRPAIIDNMVRTQVASLENIGMEVSDKMLDQMIQFAILKANKSYPIEFYTKHEKAHWDESFAQGLLIGYFLGVKYDPYLLDIIESEFGPALKAVIYLEMEDKLLSNIIWLDMPNFWNQN